MKNRRNEFTTKRGLPLFSTLFNRRALCFEPLINVIGALPGLSVPTINAINLARHADHQRRSNGPSFAPSHVQSAIITPYQTGMNGRESSGQ